MVSQTISGAASCKISVVIPAYNAAQFIGTTLESVMAQTFHDFEMVVVDDGSKDETAAVVGQYSRVRLISQQNSGVAAARNRGVRESSSEWIALLDADDVWAPAKLAMQLGVAERTSAGAVFCGLKTIDAEGREQIATRAQDTSLDMAPLLLHHESIPQGTSSTLLVRRSVFEAIGGYDESLATMADWDLLIRLRQATEFAYLPEKLTSYRRYPGTMSRNVAMLERESLLILDKVFGSDDLPPQWRQLERRSRAWNDLVLSGSHFGARHLSSALRFGLRAVRRDPSLIGRVLRLPLRAMSRLTETGK